MENIIKHINLRYLIPIALLAAVFFSARSSSVNRLDRDWYGLGRDTIDCYSLYQNALNARRLGRIEEAKNIAEQLIKKSSEAGNLAIKARTYILLADISEKDNQLQTALKHWLNAIGLISKIKENNQLQMAYERTAQVYARLDYKTLAMAYYEKAYSLWKQINPSTENPELMENVAWHCYDAKSYDRSLSFYNKLKHLYSDKKDTLAMVNTILKINDIFNRTNRKEEALSLNKDLIKIYMLKKDTVGIVSSYNSLGYDYVLAKNYEDASLSFMQALKYAKKSKVQPIHLAKIYTNLAIAYQNQHDYVSAIHYLGNTVEILQKQDKPQELANALNLMGMCYFYTGDYYNADLNLQKAITAAVNAREAEITRDCYQNYSQILQAGNEYEKALLYYQLYLHVRDSLMLSKRIKEQEQVQKQNQAEKTEKDQKLNMASEEMKDLELKQSKLETQRKQQEIELLKNQQELKDAANRQMQLEQQKKVQELELERKNKASELQRRELQSLQQEKEIQDIKLKKKELEEKERQKTIKLLEQERQSQKLQIDFQNEHERFYKWMFGLFSFIFLLVLAGFLYYRKINKKIRKQKRLLEETYHHLELKNEEISLQKDIIDQKNESIMASIMYARRIQDAILPPMEILSSCFGPVLTYYKPRDIVSGDFYWAKQLDNRILIAVADCTGHGVPGAFMSMLGIALLNEVSGHADLSSGNILTELRRQVKSSMRQTGKGTESKDGMDIAFCLIDLDSLQMQFSGAYSPLYLFRDEKLIEVRGDRMPIGIHIKEKECFTQTDIQLQKGDRIYLFSDGYVSQIGGEKGLTYKTKNFKELLHKIHLTPMERQAAILEKTYENWRGTRNQVDDILVVGFKV